MGYESHYGTNILEIMEKENLDFVKIVQIICKSHTVLKVSSNTIHRGIANNS
jgi:hypothetical protein